MKFWVYNYLAEPQVLPTKFDTLDEAVDFARTIEGGWLTIDGVQDDNDYYETLVGDLK